MGQETVCLLLLLLTSCYGQYYSNYTRNQVVGFLLDSKRYDAFSVPDFDSDVPTNVTVEISIHNVDSVSEVAMEYSVDLIIRQWWRDPRLAYDYLNTTFDYLELDPRQSVNVWQPDTYFSNEKRAMLHSVTATNKLMHIWYDGKIVSSMRLALSLSCTMDLHLYPFDAQKCPLEMQSYAYTNENINYWWQGNFSTAFKLYHNELPQFHISKEVELSYDHVYHPATGTFAILRAEMYLQRKSGFYFLQVFTPSVLLVILSWVSFWVDPKAVPARVSLGVTCVLTMTTQSSGTRMTLPPVSYVKAIDVWASMCLLFVFAALVEFAYVNVLTRRKPPGQEDEGKDGKGKDEVDHNKLAKRVDYISRVAFPVAFVVFLIVFACICAFTPKTA